MTDRPQHGDAPTERAALDENAVPAGYRLRVVCATGPKVFTLPRGGARVVGRGDEADLRLDDPSISRRHAVLYVGETLQIEDLGSANGTRVRGRTLAAGEREEVYPGDGLEFGSALCAVQGPAPGQRTRLLRHHGYFEARLEDECARAAETRGPFALVQLCAESAVDDAFEVELLEAVRTVDLVALYAPGEYEVLVPGASPEEAEGYATLLRVKLSRSARRLRAGVACHPRDGRTPQRLLARARAALHPAVATSPPEAGGFVVSDPAMRRLHELLPRVAAGAVNVLLLGETGVGKEVFAELLHRLSPRAGAPFVRLNCAAFTESLIEAELFGHERGAFTGAVAARPGLLESAQGGVVFLDEVAELPLTIQAKLLRVLEERKVRRVGGLQERAFDLRLVAATNRDPEAEVAQGRFRADLYYRLNGFSLVIPPLRDRVAEVAPLARHFGATARKQAGFTGPAEIDAEALRALERYRWPGNVRELRNVIERAVLLAGDAIVTLEHLPVEKFALGPRAAPSAPSAPSAQAPEAGERERIIEALEQCVGNQTRAAQLLGITRRQLISRLERYDLPRPRK